MSAPTPERMAELWEQYYVKRHLASEDAIEMTGRCPRYAYPAQFGELICTLDAEIAACIRRDGRTLIYTFCKDDEAHRQIPAVSRHYRRQGFTVSRPLSNDYVLHISGWAT